jgi:tRNA modification GTPase
LNKKINKQADTIAACATAAGSSGLALIRVSGPSTAKITKKIIGTALKPMRARYSKFLSPDRSIVDSGIALYFKAPKSYTGENTLELTCHGGSAVVDQILQALVEYGARLAGPGEFTKRAFLNDKMDLTQAEAVADLIESSSAATARAAKRSLDGVFSTKILNLGALLSDIRVNVEASLDFPEEDLKETGQHDWLIFKTNETKDVFSTLLKSTKLACRIREGAVVALTGKPNVGKSTLMNALCGHERAIVSETPGTTRDTLDEDILIDGYKVRLIDTAGIREPENIIEEEGVNRAIKAARNADIVIHVVDGSAGQPTKKKTKTNDIVVLNKNDLTRRIFGKVKNKANMFRLSALTGEGVGELVNHISNYFNQGLLAEETLTARRRHLSALKEANKHFLEAEAKISTSRITDLVAEDLLQAQNALSEITGESTSEDLLEKIFNEFCIGK